MKKEEIKKKLEFEFWIKSAEILSFLFLTSGIIGFTYYDMTTKYPDKTLIYSIFFVTIFVSVMICLFFWFKAKLIVNRFGEKSGNAKHKKNTNEFLDGMLFGGIFVIVGYIVIKYLIYITQFGYIEYHVWGILSVVAFFVMFFHLFLNLVNKNSESNF